MLIVSNFLLWVVVLLQLVALAALGRKVRQARATGRMEVPSSPITQTGADRWVSGERGAGMAAVEPRPPVMLLYVAAGCPAGQRLIPDAELMARAESLQFILAREDGGAAASPFHRVGRGGRQKTGSGPLAAPYAMILDETGDIAAHGPVKSRPELARLMARASGERAPAVVATRA